MSERTLKTSDSMTGIYFVFNRSMKGVCVWLLLLSVSLRVGSVPIERRSPAPDEKAEENVVGFLELRQCVRAG